MASPPQLTPSLLAASAQYAARVAAVGYLREVSQQFDAFAADSGAGVHDLRVALRRLRTWMRAYRPELDDTVGRKTRKRARQIADATNEPRDLEAMLEWVARQDELATRERTGARWLAERLTREHRDADARMRKRVTRRMPKLVAKLSDRFQIYWTRCSIDDPGSSPTMAEATRDVLGTGAERFARACDRIASQDDATKIHRVRIAAKRLRYVLETIEDPAAAAVVERLSTLQDVLGESHDMHGAVDRIVRELGELGARDARVLALRAVHPDDESDEHPRLARLRPGLIALAARARETERARYKSFCSTWTDDEVATTVIEVKSIGERVATHAARAG